MKGEVTPILFKGVAQELAQFADLRVELLPKLPAGAKLSRCDGVNGSAR
jgi:hypothetical protein